MQRVILIIVTLFVSLPVYAGGMCASGYVPRSALMAVVAEDMEKLSLSADDRAVVVEKMNAFDAALGEKMRALEESKAALSACLSVDHPNRKEADGRTQDVVDAFFAIGELRVQYVEDLSDRLGPDKVRQMRARHAPARSCGLSPELSWSHCRLSRADLLLSGMTEDEEKYVKDFNRRETYFKQEAVRLTAELDRVLAARIVDKDKAKELLAELKNNMQSEMLARLDRCYYFDQVFFTPERAAKIEGYRSKKKRK